jgi:ABC-type polysaccharide/polyol phosphate export permease
VLDSWVRRLEILFFLSQSRMKSYAHDRLLGFLWWILDPLFQIGIYVILMEHIIKSSQPRYPLFLACAVIPWRFLAHGSSSAGTSILANAGLLKSVNIDRIFMPLSEVINSLVYFLYALPTLLVLMLFYGITPSFHLLWIPLVVVVEFMLVAGLGLLLSVGTVYLRDAENLWQFILYAWFFLSPTLYPPEQVPEAYRTLYLLNPAAGIIDSFRRSILAGAAPDPRFLLSAALVSSLILCLAVLVFRRCENEAMRLL